MYSKNKLVEVLRKSGGDSFPICAEVVLGEWLEISDGSVSYIISIYMDTDGAPACELDGGATWLSLEGYDWLLRYLRPRNYQKMLRDLDECW